EVPGGRLAEGGVAGRLDEAGDPVHGPAEGFGLVPVPGAGGAVPDLRDAVGVDGELVGGGALGAEGTAVDRAVGVALDVDDLAVADADQLRAADGAVGADAGHLAGVGELEAAGGALGGPQVEAEPEQAAQREAAPH